MWAWSVCAAASAADGTAHPDLSGTWTLAPAPKATPGRGDLGSGWGSPLTVAQDADGLSLQYVFFAPGDLQGPLRFAYAFDGHETVAVVRMGHGAQALRSRARWEGERLVVVTTFPLEDPVTHAALTVDVTRTLSLETPTTLLVETTRAGVLGGRPTATTVRYTRD